jgi:hypothetical protein
MKNSVKLLTSLAAVSVITLLGACAEETVAPGTDTRNAPYFDLGCEAGRGDRQANMSMVYERHAGAYDTEAEPTFQAGYEKCWMEG